MINLEIKTSDHSFLKFSRFSEISFISLTLSVHLSTSVFLYSLILILKESVQTASWFSQPLLRLDRPQISGMADCDACNNYRIERLCTLSVLRLPCLE